MRDEFELSRRKMLAGIGTVGAASTGAGMGTSAFFSDREDFEGNRLVAGELDMMVDWEEHYSDWSEDENNDRADERSDLVEPDDPDENTDDDPYDEEGGDTTDDDGDGENDFPIRMWDGDPGTTGSESDLLEDGDGNNVEFGMPIDDEWLIAVPDEYVDDFMRNTAIEAFPDEDDDGIQDTIKTRDQISSENPGLTKEQVETLFRAQFADVPDDLGSDTRTESSRGDPLIDLDDVKPGDFGEVTFSFHLFNNPGYIWLDAELVDADENGYTEPELKDEDEVTAEEYDGERDDLFDNEGDESGDTDDSNSTDPGETAQEPVELLDEIRVIAWHDNGDNLLQETELVHAPHDVDSESTIELTKEQAIITDGVLTLREFLRQASSGGIPLDADTRDAERDCYPNSTTRYVCFAWWLPVDHANEIQTDSVSFDLGFYTEQCRHNDGTTRQSPEQ
jgi:predicted ribosomally synthesized peptide with SipW-like signal peptide